MTRDKLYSPLFPHNGNWKPLSLDNDDPMFIIKNNPDDCHVLFPRIEIVQVKQNPNPRQVGFLCLQLHTANKWKCQCGRAGQMMILFLKQK